LIIIAGFDIISIELKGIVKLSLCTYIIKKTSPPWNYKILSDIFVNIELFTYSYSVTIYLHYVMCFVH